MSSEQEKMDYVEFAKSKGLMSGQIFFKHILRNIMPSLVSYSKSIILMLLSNLVLTEYMFGMDGLSMFIYSHPIPIIFTVSLLLVFIVFSIFYSILAWIIKKLTGKKVVI